MKVLHYIDRWLPLSAGFVDALVTRSSHPSVVVSRDATVNRDAFPHRPVVSLGPLSRLGEGRAAGWTRHAVLAAVITAARVKVIHVHFGYAVHDVLPAVRRTGLPLVLSLHGDDATALPKQRPGFYDPVADSVDAVVVPSRWLAERAEELGFPLGRIHVIPSGVDVGLFTPTPVPEGPPIVAFVGRLVAKKGLATLLEAWEAVARAVPGSRLHVLGEGPEGHLLAPEVIPAGVELLRPDPQRRHLQVRDLIRCATVVTSPSQTSPDGDAESLLLVNLEAQASGRAVVTTRHGGIPEFVEEGHTALLVAERSSAELATALIRVLTDRPLATRMGASGPAVAARFDVRAGAAQVDELYDRVVEESRHGR